MSKKEISRREFLQIAAISAGAIGFNILPDGLTPKNIGLRSAEEVEVGEKGMEVLKIVEYEGVVKALSLPIVFAPLRKDYFYNEKRDIELWRVKDISLGINKIFYIRDGENRAFRAATLHHNTGDHNLPIVILDEGQIDNVTQEYWPFRKYGQLSEKKDITVEFSLIGEYYPNKTHNLLEAAAQFLRYQIEHGPFEQDTTYSAIEILNLRGNYNYKSGKENDLGNSLWGDGICGITTVLAHTLSQADVRFDEHRGHSHWNQYWTGPLDPDISVDNDTAISIIKGVNRDFKWTPLMEKSHYLSIKALLAITAPPVRDLTGDANSKIFFQLMLRKEKPDLLKELAQIEKLQEDYARFNRGLGTSELLLRSSLVEKIPWGTETPQDSLIRAIYVEENTKGFENEIGKEAYLKEIVELKNIVHKYVEKYPCATFIPESTVRVGSYIKESDWYKSLTSDRRVKLERVLNYLDNHTYRYGVSKYQLEAVQCVGWAILLAYLEYDSSPVSILSHPAVCARDLIPEELRTQVWRKKMTIGRYKYMAPEKLSEINVGDLFVPYDLPFKSTAGHVGVIIGKKEIGEETTLLVSDSNRKSEGKPRLFKVNRANAHAIFGRPPKRWLIIRKSDEDNNRIVKNIVNKELLSKVK